MEEKACSSDGVGKLVTAVYEQGEYVNSKEAEALVGAAFDSLPRERRPLRIDAVRAMGKLAEPCLALPDFVLGAWQQLACGHDPNYQQARDRDELLYRTLQPRIGTVFHPSTGRRFTTRVPFEGLGAPPDASSAPAPT